MSGDHRPRPKRRTAAALRYDVETESAPRVVASGHGQRAEEIVDLAREHKVPVHADPQLAELLACLDVGARLPEELYLIVAEILVFVHELDKGFTLLSNWQEAQAEQGIETQAAATRHPTTPSATPQHP